MSIVHRLLSAGPAWSAHHRIMLDALTLLKADAGWRRLFLRHSARLLAGADTPEHDFADFKNHVLLVRDSNWGGAPAAARAWYLRLVYGLRDQLWSEAAFAAGVLGHYVIDPLMPMHAGQSETACAVHFGIDCAIDRMYAKLKDLLASKLGGYPEIAPAGSKDWIERLVRQGAEQAFGNTESLIDHCELNLLLHRPNDGMDEEAQTLVAKMIGLATSTLACVWDRAIEESGVSVPKVGLFGLGLSLLVRSPFAWMQGPVARLGRRSALHKMVREYQKTGKVIQTLAPSEREIRQLHAIEVRRIALSELDAESIRPIGSKHPRMRTVQAALEMTPESATAATAMKAEKARRSEPAKVEKLIKPAIAAVEAPAFVEAPRAERLASPLARELEVLALPPPAPKTNVPLPPAAPAPKPVPPPAPKPAPPPPLRPPAMEPPAVKVQFPVGMSSPVNDAPGITPQIAEQLIELGVENVGDLLTVDPKVVVDELRSAGVTIEKALDWQAAAALACQLPEFRANDVLLLISAGVHDPRQLSRFSPKELLDRLQPFLKATDSPDMIRLDPPPTLRDAGNWIELAKKARPLSAAA